MEEREKLKKEITELMTNTICTIQKEISDKQSRIDFLKNSICNKINNFKDIEIEYDRDFAKLLKENFVIKLKKYVNIIKENGNKFKFISKKLEDKDNKQMMKSIKIQEIENKAQKEFSSKNSKLLNPKERIFHKKIY